MYLSVTAAHDDKSSSLAMGSATDNAKPQSWCPLKPAVATTAGLDMEQKLTVSNNQ
jgi:hypothetical protein